MKAICLPVKGVLYYIFVIFLSLIVRFVFIYNSIEVQVSKNNVLEYGTANYNVESLLANVSGDVVSVFKDINVNKIGTQELILSVEKENIVKKVPIEIEVVDSVAPIILLKEDEVVVNSGVNYDLLSNIVSVNDIVDGEIKYKNFSDVTEDDVNYYTIDGIVDTNVVGVNEINVIAVDKYGNKSNDSFKVKVRSHGKESSLTSVAYSLLGKPYVSGGSSLSGFDCSGFVQYVYARCGLRVSRSASTQLYDGYEVLYNNVKPGDILVWGYGINSITHTGIYVGNGKMIHAANPNDGVIVNDVATWGKWTGVRLISVRRLK